MAKNKEMDAYERTQETDAKNWFSTKTQFFALFGLLVEEIQCIYLDEQSECENFHVLAFQIVSIVQISG